MVPEISLNVTYKFLSSTLFILVVQISIQLYICSTVDSRSLFCQNSTASNFVGIICMLATILNFLIIFSIKWNYVMEVKWLFGNLCVWLCESSGSVFFFLGGELHKDLPYKYILVLPYKSLTVRLPSLDYWLKRLLILLEY